MMRAGPVANATASTRSAARFRPTALTRTFGALLGSQIAGRLIRFVYLLVLARQLEPSGLGIYLYGTAVYVGLMGFAGFGQGVFLAERLPRRTAGAGIWFAHSLTIRLGATVLAGLAGLAYAMIWESDPAIRAVVLVFIVALLIRSFVQWVRESHVALEDAGWIPRYEALFRLLEASIGVLLVLAGADVLWLAALHAAIWGAEAVASAALVVRRGRWRPRLGRRWRLLAPMTKSSLWFLGSTGGLLVFAQAPLMTLGLLGLPAAELGRFGIAAQAYFATLLVPSTLAMALVPAVSRVHRRADKADLQAVGTLIRWTLAAGTLIAIIAAAAAPWAFRTLLGSSYASSAAYFTVLAWAVGANAAAIIIVQALNALGAKKSAAATAVFMLLVQFAVATTLFLNGQGGGAASAGVLAGAVAGYAAGVWRLRGLVPIGDQLQWWLPLLLLLCAAVIMLASPFDTAATGVVCVVLLGLAYRVTRLMTREDLQYLVGRFSPAKQSTPTAS
jgi:O-antigen/teichoic acid export membrane protein